MPGKRQLYSWLKALEEYVEDTEAPRQFWFWAVLATISSVLQRKVFLPYGFERVYPNLYVMLIADPASRKGVPVKECEKFIKRLQIATSRDSCSKREFTKRLAAVVDTQKYFDTTSNLWKGQSALTVISKELSSLLALAPKGMIECLTEPSGRAEYRSGTFLSVPLEGARGLLGVLNVTDPVGQDRFDAEDCHLLLHLAERVATAWEQTLAMERSQAGVADTTRTLREGLQHLERGRASAPDRVRLARGLARALGLGESEAGVISFAASIHDVGMAHVSPGILHEPGQLDPEVWAQVAQQPARGVELMKPIEFQTQVSEIIMAHHERMDGRVYPRGLHGDEIPLASRIIAVADAYESMTLGRPYRLPMSHDEAAAELRRCAGTQFDGRVVEVFLQVVTEAEDTKLVRAPEAA